ncbi:hypothetical protein [Rhodopirellula sp. P2]|uniref:hypothetical protein n=1 Tax=Rhodopirellula sp. P2 TaxID=2127060 RepID=UPI0023682F0E|nr:hypothetical protein [Rhodopirellula sp. P2]WDQ19117.1 hypothetical protein PSR62_11380 [Rhodopirellula sp. P2]
MPRSTFGVIADADSSTASDAVPAGSDSAGEVTGPAPGFVAFESMADELAEGSISEGGDFREHPAHVRLSISPHNSIPR